ncbi:winged helix-turn-helix transcriptional regulator [Bacillus sp. HNR-4]|nr:winged helix-turn-helix transcriptional regulator [Bacillus sp. HNR-4]
MMTTHFLNLYCNFKPYSSINQMLSLGLINHFLLEYSLTDYGSSLGAILDSLCTWGEVHLEKNGNTSVLITADE